MPKITMTMTVTAKPLDTTLTIAEQIELRMFMRMKEPRFIPKSEPVRMVTIKALEAKGYVEPVEDHGTYITYQLTKKE